MSDALLSIPSLDAIEDEVRAGLPMDRDRREAAAANEDFYRGENCKHLERRESEAYRDYLLRPKRYSRLTRKAVRTLASLLYSPGPQRNLRGDGPEVAYLEAAWRANHINRLMHQADQKATLNDCCAVQAVATGDPARPVRLYLWGAEEFSVFLRDDDPATPWAVATVAVIQQGRKKSRRYEAWSALEHRVYTTKPIDVEAAFDTSGGTLASYRRDLSGTVDADRAEGDARNPYGVLPFAFVWNERPVDRFWGGGVGGMLRECNEEIDRELSETAEHVQAFLNPDLFMVNVAPGFRLRKKAGEPIHLPSSGSSREGDSGDPTIFALQVQLGVQAAWWDAQKYANQTFHELDVPLSAVRDDQQGPTSGFQVIAEQVPLLSYTRSRQPDFAEYEEDLARLICRVGGNYYGDAALASAAETLSLSLTWLPPAPPVPSPELDAHDKNDLDLGLVSRIGLLMRRGMTRDQAEDYLAQVAADRELEDEVFDDGASAVGDEDDATDDGEDDSADDTGDSLDVE